MAASVLAGLLEGARECALALGALSGAAYLHALRGVQPGWLRLAAAAPLLAAFSLAPLLYDPLTEPVQVMLAINFPWLTNSAVLGWALGRGPLVQGLPFRASVAFLLAPALPHSGRGRTPAFKFSWLVVASRVCTMAAAAYVFECRSPPLGPLLHGVLQSITLYCFVSTAMESAAVVAQLLSGMPVVPPFNSPYCSSSLSDFWSRRWNVVPGTTFRQTVYDPICEGLAAPQNGPAAVGAGRPGQGGTASGRRVAPLRRALGVCATFLASGLIHDLSFWFLTRRHSARWMLFFALQGPLLLVEAWLRALCRQAGIRLPRPLRVAATLAVLHTLAVWIFFPDLTEHFLPRRMLHQVLRQGPSSAPAAAGICSLLGGRP